MVGLVLVSHSAELAAAVKALAEQQTQGRAAIAAVGGTGFPDQPFGTDAMAILEAIQSVYSDDGVLVLMDLGSAIMSAETALEFMDPDQAAHVRLSPAPFIEGAMAASVQASIGMDLDAVAAEALEAMGPKQESLGAPEASKDGISPRDAIFETAPAEAATVSGQVMLINPAGLHFGPAVQFVQLAASHQAEISVVNLVTGAGPANAKRFNQVLSLGAEQGHEIQISAQGLDAQTAVDALLALTGAGFGEVEAPAETTPVPAQVATSGRGRLALHGIAASPGVAVGTAVLLTAAAPAVQRYVVDDPAQEWTRYQAAVEQARDELLALAERMARELGPQQSRIFQAHAMLLSDEDLKAQVRAAIHEERANVEAALSDVFGAEAERLHSMAGPRFQERAADLRDLAGRLLRILDGRGGVAPPSVDLPDQAIIVAEDLAPSQTAALDRSRVVGFCTALGGPTAHTAILARSMGIPAVVGMGEALLAQVRTGVQVAIDGAAGALILHPDAETAAAFEAQRQADLSSRSAAFATAQAAARTADGKHVEVVANLATAADAPVAVQAGAEGVGLLRTEFIFQERTDPPSEEEQYAIYREVAEAMAGRPVVIRTLDIGGDKPAPYLQLPAEANPFLGWRAIRISLALPEFFKVQLRAILRAALHGRVLVMFPMIATVEEVVQAQTLLAEAEAELASQGVPHAASIPTGIMVEVPSAAMMADQLAPLIDFFSIGTNDLTQYTFAADRGNARVANVGDPLHPAVLRQIARVIDAAHGAGKWVGLCGELAGRPEGIPVLLGLGLDEFSMSASSVPAAKALLARLNVPDAQQLARRVLNLSDAAAVKAEVKRFMEGLKTLS
jgi:phosphocarrier protein FPr